MSKQKIPTFSEFLETHEFIQAAIVEAAHRYYYTYCFNDDGKFSDVG